MSRTTTRTSPSAAPEGAAVTGSWQLEVPAGAYGRIPAWPSGAAWFDALMDTLATAEGEMVRRRVSIAPATLLAVARADWQSADVVTGRGVTTAHETVAAALRMSKITVRRAREVIQELGFAVVVVEGRYLTTAEREAAHAIHGGSQLRAASVRALTTPRSSGTVENEHLPFSQKGSLTSFVLKTKPKRARAQKTASRSGPRQQSTKTVQARVPRPVAVQKLAAGLVSRLPWLARNTHIGHVCDVLLRVGVEPDRWSAAAVLGAIDLHVASVGLRVVDPAGQRDPVAYFAWLLRQAVSVVEETAFERARREQEEARQRRQTQIVAEQAARARAATLSLEELTRIRAESDAQIAALNAVRRHSLTTVQKVSRFVRWGDVDD